MSAPSGPLLKVFVCPRCGVQIASHFSYDALPQGHYHPKPEGHGWGEYVKAEEVEVIPVVRAEELEADMAKAGQRLEKLRAVAESAMWEIDGIFKYFLVSGLSEEGGGLPLYEQSKGLAEARASLAATFAEIGEDR